MDRPNILWPRHDERRLLGRFYLVDGIAEFFNVVWPFQFAYLFMVMEHPQWAVIPLLVESIVALLAEIPSGAFADRYSRRRAVILGDSLTAAGMAMVPFSAHLHGSSQLAGVCISFGIMGLGQAMVSGAGEAWVVDNLAVAGREDLVKSYFGRINSFTALGGAGAGLVALLLLVWLEISRQLIDALWYIAALGVLLGVLIESTIAERRPVPTDVVAQYRRVPLLASIRLGFRALRRSRILLFLVLAMVIASFPESAADDAFDMSLITKGMDARGLAPLGIINNIIGIAAPLIGMALLRAFGATRVLSLFLVMPVVAVSSLFVAPVLEVVIVLYILLDFFDGVWDPVADTHLQTMVTSDRRATIVSITNYGGGIMELLGIAVFAWLLGEHAEQLSELVPDPVSAFSGGSLPVTDMSLTQFMLSVPDLAIVVFVCSAVFALPFVLLSGGSSRCKDDDSCHAD